MRTSKLKPGVLVCLKTSIKGGISYHKRDVEDVKDGNRESKTWETTKVVDDVTEVEDATKCRNDARGLIARTCIKTQFGLLCPESETEALDEAIRDARVMVTAFNQTHDVCQIRLYVLKGTIATTDEEAARAIINEVGDLIEDMNAGIETLDVDAIRRAATDAKRIGVMLAEEQNEQIQTAVTAARKAAREIVKRVEDESAEAIKEAIVDIAAPIALTRMTFLDLDATEAETTTTTPDDAMPEINVQRIAEIDE